MVGQRTRRRGRLSSAEAQTLRGSQLCQGDLRGEATVPYACQILRGTTGNSGKQPKCDQGSHTTPPQVGTAILAKGPEVPKVRARVRVTPVRGALCHLRTARSFSAHAAQLPIDVLVGDGPPQVGMPRVEQQEYAPPAEDPARPEVSCTR